ncbi:MAG: YncE family protein, partial [Solirubrobacteraceae bacterium]
TRDYEYVFVDGEAYVYDVGRGQRLVQTISLPGITSIRGVGMDLRDRLLYISYGGDGGSDGTGSLAAYDPVAGRIVWNVAYPHGVDSFAIASDGARIYLPEGERAPGGRWWVIDAANGSTLGSITAGVGPHNTVVGISGSRVYLGPRNTPYLYVASTRTDRVIRRLGPLYSGVRPFTINGRETLAYTTATGLLGFQASSIATGRVLYTEAFGGRFRWDPATWPLTAPSHGISLSPDDRHLFVIDTPNAYVHVFDVSGLPRHAPRQIANVRLSHSFAGQQAQCSQDCERDGWLQSSLNGCYVYVGDSGDVISATTYRRVGYLPALRNSRETVEIDWRGDVPVATSTKSGLGYATGRSRPPRPRCR